MKKEKRFRIYFGYEKSDYVSIPEEKLAQALDVYQSGEKVFSFKGKLFKGKDIKKIEPDFRYYTGWFDTYSPTNQEDQNQIRRDCPPNLERCIDDAMDFLEAGGKPQEYENYLLENKPKELYERN